MYNLVCCVVLCFAVVPFGVLWYILVCCGNIWCQKYIVTYCVVLWCMFDVLSWYILVYYVILGLCGIFWSIIPSCKILQSDWLRNI
jgi:hypothetical protein